MKRPLEFCVDAKSSEEKEGHRPIVRGFKNILVFLLSSSFDGIMLLQSRSSMDGEIFQYSVNVTLIDLNKFILVYNHLGIVGMTWRRRFYISSSPGEGKGSQLFESVESGLQNKHEIHVYALTVITHISICRKVNVMMKFRVGLDTMYYYSMLCNV